MAGRVLSLHRKNVLGVSEEGQRFFVFTFVAMPVRFEMTKREGLVLTFEFTFDSECQSVDTELREGDSA